MKKILVLCAQCGPLTETPYLSTVRRIAGGHRRAHPKHEITVTRKKEAK